MEREKKQMQKKGNHVVVECIHPSPLLKRLFDLCASLICLVLLSPLVLLCIVWIKLFNPGPVFYRQWRVGQGGWLFRIYKFRTMHLGAESGVGACFASACDSRVAFGCRWMRRSHVDELPQLWNIVLGQMSLVGPRPERPEILEEMRGYIPRIDRRLSVKPGLTGLAQLQSGYANDVNGTRRKLAYDFLYLRRQSFRQDVGLVLRTFPKFWDQQSL